MEGTTLMLLKFPQTTLSPTTATTRPFTCSATVLGFALDEIQSRSLNISGHIQNF